MTHPFSLVAELTYACPLRCPYCSNPVSRPRGEELPAEVWGRVVDEAAALGVVQVHLSGGEPTLRPDLLVDVVARAARHGLYTNLITSAYRLDEALLARLAAAGLDHVQISLQDADPASADRLAGTASHARKLDAARRVKARGLPLTLNVVLHRHNLDRIEAIIALAESLGADRLELANAQYYGWALANRPWLLPTRAQLERAFAVVEAARRRIGPRMQVIHVAPDYFTGEPKPCMDGWARRHLTVTPDGRALPCPAAGDITTLAFPSVRERALAWIWFESAAFNAYRGDAWMQEPCRSCPRKGIDFGGCRCQAFALAGDAAAADPACRWSPHHRVVVEAVAAAEAKGPSAANVRDRTAPRQVGRRSRPPC